jgi:hypothetical protein
MSMERPVKPNGEAGSRAHNGYAIGETFHGIMLIDRPAGIGCFPLPFSPS